MTLYEIQETMIDNLNIFLESEGSEFDQEVYEEIIYSIKQLGLWGFIDLMGI